MAIIETTLTLQDMMSNALASIKSNVTSLDTKVTSVGDSIKDAFDYTPDMDMANIEMAVNQSATLSENMQEVNAGIEEASINMEALDLSQTIEDTDDINTNLQQMQPEIENASEEFERWNRRFDEAVGNTEDINNNLQRTPPIIRSAGEGFSRWGAAVIVANQALETTRTIVGAINRLVRDTIDESRQNLAVNLRLQRVLINQSGDINIARQEYEMLVSAARAFTLETGVSETALRAATAEIVRYTGNANMAVDMMEIMADTVLGMSEDLTVSASEMQNLGVQIGRAMSTGNLRLLTRLPIYFGEAHQDAFKLADEMERMNIIASALGVSYGGLTRVLAQTPIMPIELLNNEMSNLRAATGDTALIFRGVFADTILRFMPYIEARIERLTNFFKDNFTEAVSVVGIAVAGLGVALGILAAKKLIVFAKPLIIIGSIIAAVQLLGIRFQTLLAIVVGVFEGIWNVGKWAGEQLVSFFRSVIGTITGFFDTFFDYVGEGFKQNDELIKDIFANLLDFMIEIVNFMVMPFREFANFLGNVFVSPVGAVIRLFENMGNQVFRIVEPIVNLLNMLPGVNIDFDAIRQGFHSMAAQAYERFAPDFEARDIWRPLEATGRDIVDRFTTGFTSGMDRANNLVDSMGDVMERFRDFSSSDWPNVQIDPATGALKVAQQGPIEIRGENLRMLVNIAARRYAVQYREREVHFHNSIANPQINNINDYETIVDRLVRDALGAYRASAAIP